MVKHEVPPGENQMNYTACFTAQVVKCHIGKEGVLLRNVSAAPICDHFRVVAPGCWIREPVPFLT